VKTLCRFSSTLLN